MRKIICMYFLMMIFPFTAYSKEIVLVADQWCPYNCVPASKAPGFIVEAAREIFEAEGYSINYIDLPWLRAIQGVRNGQYDGIIGTGKLEPPAFIFPTEPLGVTTATFFVKKGNTWRYKGLESLEEILLGVIQGYSYGTLNEDYIVHNKNDAERIQVLSGENILPRLRYMLENRRIDAFIEGDLVYKYFLQSTDHLDLYKEAGNVGKEEIFIAFSPVKSDSRNLALLLDRGLVKLRESGKFMVFRIGSK